MHRRCNSLGNRLTDNESVLLCKLMTSVISIPQCLSYLNNEFFRGIYAVAAI